MTAKSKLRKPLKPKQPAFRKPSGAYTRLYLGGAFDGLRESAPIYRGKRTLRPIINKQGWRNGREPYDNICKLAEPAQKAVNGATYIYQHQP